MKYASLSIDLDDMWSYMKTHGDEGWKDFPSYLDYCVPRILDFLDKFNVKITFFIIGKDAAIESNSNVMREIAARGHEIANHSFQHDPWLKIYTEEETLLELTAAEEAIERVTGKHPVGFRGPGFSFSENTFKVLAQKGYLYDATKFPTFLSPLARIYFLMSSNLSRDEKAKRKSLFGKFSDGFESVKPYVMNIENSKLVEIPVTTMPVFKLPIHASYILYLSIYSKKLALAYFRFALFLCQLSNTNPSILLHPLDFLGCDDFDDLAFFPAMKLKSNYKMDIMENIFEYLLQRFRLITMHEHAKRYNGKL